MSKQPKAACAAGSQPLLKTACEQPHAAHTALAATSRQAEHMPTGKSAISLVHLILSRSRFFSEDFLQSFWLFKLFKVYFFISNPLSTINLSFK